VNRKGVPRVLPELFPPFVLLMGDTPPLFLTSCASSLPPSLVAFSGTVHRSKLHYIEQSAPWPILLGEGCGFSHVREIPFCLLASPNPRWFLGAGLIAFLLVLRHMPTVDKSLLFLTASQDVFFWPSPFSTGSRSFPFPTSASQRFDPLFARVSGIYFFVALPFYFKFWPSGPTIFFFT